MTGLRIRISSRVAFHLEGSQAWADRDKPAHPLYNDPSVTLMRKLAAAKVRPDGSCTLSLTLFEAESLYDQVDTLAVVARQDAGPGDTSALAELNAARACLRALARLGIK